MNDVRQVGDLPAALQADPWAAASEHRRKIAEARAALVSPLAELVKNGASRNNVAKLFMARVLADFNDPASAHALKVLGTTGASMATLKRWISAYLVDGKAGLLPKHTGRVRQNYGWEVRAVALYNTPSKPGFADVAWALRSEGFGGATESRVKRYLKALPATLGDKSPARIGKHLHRLTRQKYQRRSVDELLTGEIYAG
ncbi:MAG: transposase, partial [Burkholderiaceae bacterium]|nr:transposase [Burkholderiaceae bacterium]